jgi:succinylglutamate desuccinylase
MVAYLESELIRFRSFAAGNHVCGQVESVAEDILRFIPFRFSGGSLKAGFLAVVHGNEIIGLPLINSVLEDLCSGLLITEHELYFALGNIPSLFAGKRFIEKDLNRAFGQSSVATLEDQRAREIETHFLDKIDYLIDFHQTIQPTLRPFFIFQYSSPNCFNHLSLMNPGVTTILQFDGIGENQNLSSDEYLRKRQRFGVTVELGQSVVTEEMFQLGRSVCEKVISCLNDYTCFSEISRPAAQVPDYLFFEITGKITAKSNSSTLNPHLQNFMKFAKGDVLGESLSGALIADQAGSVLFPKLGQTVDKGRDLLFVCDILSEAKLFLLAAPNLMPRREPKSGVF